MIQLPQELLDLLPPLDRRVRRGELQQLAREVSVPVSSAALVNLALEHRRRAEEVRAKLTRAQELHRAAGTPAERMRVVLEAAGERSRRLLRAARLGWFDLEALVERVAYQAEHEELLAELGLKLGAAAASCDEAGPLFQHLVAELRPLPRSHFSRGLCEALAILARRAPAACPALEREELLANLRDANLPRRFQAALAQTCLEIDRSRATEVIGQRLRSPSSAADDFIIRQRLVTLLGQYADPATEPHILIEQVVRPDSSEHVRMAVPGALARSGHPAALRTLRGLLEDPRESSPRVRACAAIAISRAFRAGQLPLPVELVTATGDRDPLVGTAAALELGALAEDGLLAGENHGELRSRVLSAASWAKDARQVESCLRLAHALAVLADPALSEQINELQRRCSRLAPGMSVTVRSKLPPPLFGRAMAAAAVEGFGLYARAVRGGYRVTHGARFVPRAWRIWHELRHRTPYKRQDGIHTIARHFAGELRAHPRSLAEATTTIPGEPLYSQGRAGWAPHLPLVDDLLSTPFLVRKKILLFSPRGTTRIAAPQTLWGRIRAHWTLSAGYAHFAELRNLALSPRDPSEETRYSDALHALGFQLSLQSPPEAPGQLPADGAIELPFRVMSRVAGVALLLLPPPGEVVAQFWHYLQSPAENSIAQLGLGAALLAGTLLAINIVRRERIRRERSSVALVIGGWGTRGKSGTERLKAAVFQGLGIQSLAKTTGCEAMFIHGAPAGPATEIFIHRSYDKATIWEQRQLLRLAARLHVPVFLWECMALSPPLVDVVQNDWTRDDLSTLTNAYPDHEDIQGPAGHDVARALSSFIRRGGRVITSEEQMLPIFRDEARRKGAALIELGPLAHELLAQDLLARFPYEEHPRNIALVRRVAEELGVDPDLATADMADHVVPDLGVLKAYPRMAHAGRAFTFINGMSANERTGFLTNWQRMGCDLPHSEGKDWIVTVVNNRFDRVARSKVFAEILVRDAPAERHILIGTNLAGFRVYVEDALGGYLDELSVFRPEDGETPDEALVRVRLNRMRHHLRIGAANPAALERELHAWGGLAVPLPADGVQDALERARDLGLTGASFGAVLDEIAALPVGKASFWGSDSLAVDRRAFGLRSLARRGFFDALEGKALEALRDPTRRGAVLKLQRRIYTELFLEMIVEVADSAATGDQVIDAIARSIPPGTHATLMGTQNIKGTGLDFVYRFIRASEVERLARDLEGASGAEAGRIALDLASMADTGLLDRRLALSAVEATAARLGGNSAAQQSLTSAQEVLRSQVAAAERALTQRKSGTGGWRWLIEKSLDGLDAVARRWRADRVVDALVHREISHSRAALEMRRLVEREKKGWLRA